MRSITYQPDNVVNVVTTLGSTLAIQFADSEIVQDIWVSDSAKKDCKVQGAGNIALIKPAAVMPAAPMFVRTALRDGGFRLYTFQLQVKEGDTAEGTPDTMFRIRFAYPAEEAAAKRAAATKAWRERQERQVQARLATAKSLAAPNWRYVAQGDRNLVPAETWDDGQSTFLRFTGNVRIPAVYVINPDGKEALVDYSVEAGLVTIHQTAPQFRLRDGDTVLAVFNRAWDPLGSNPGTGTTTPAVTRELRSAGR
jgi:type IV secretion system protein VirB9